MGRIDEAIFWCKLAMEDYLSNRIKVDPKVNLVGTTRAFCFHSQQMMEKYLKAYLALHDKTIEKSHALDVLCMECAKIDDRFENIMPQLHEMTVYAVEARYGKTPVPSFARSKQSFRNAVELEEFLMDIDCNMYAIIQKIKEIVDEKTGFTFPIQGMRWFQDKEDWEDEKDAVRYHRRDFPSDDEELEEKLREAFYRFDDRTREEELFPENFVINLETDEDGFPSI